MFTKFSDEMAARLMLAFLPTAGREERGASECSMFFACGGRTRCWSRRALGPQLICAFVGRVIMARVRKIERNPENKNYFVVDANFMANKYIPPNLAPDPSERRRIEQCLEWWEEIDGQVERDKARVYIPDICIAETFKVLAKKYFKDQ